MNSNRLLTLTCTLAIAFMMAAFISPRAVAQTPPANDQFDNAASIQGAIAQVIGSNVGATKEPGEPNHAGNAGGASVWWNWTAPDNGVVTLDTIGSGLDTLLAVYTGTAVSGLTAITSNDDIIRGNIMSRLTFDAVAGMVYRIAVDGFSSDQGDIVINLWLGPMPPSITTEPQGGIALLGDSFTLSVDCTGTPPLNYQWLKESVSIPEATNSTYQISNVSAIDAGVYIVLISNSVSQTASANAILEVSPVTITSQPQSLTVAAGYGATMSVTAAGTDPVSYQWQKDGALLSGATNSSLTFNSVQYANGGIYSVVVSNDLGFRLSSNAVLTVITPYTFTPFAGLPGTSGTNDGVGRAARFYWPHGLAVDKTGNVYVTEIGNEDIRRITPDGTVTTLVRLRSIQTTWGPFSAPWGVAVDGSNNVYIADTGNQTILKLTTDGVLATLAGAAGRSGSADGTNGAARFYYPSGLVVDGQGNVYVADWYSCKIRKVTPEGVVTTIAGSRVNGFANGWWTKASFNMPSGIGLDSSGNLYVADEGNNLVRKITNGKVVSTLAGGFNGPHGGAVDSSGNVYIADMNYGMVRRVSPGGMVTTLAGNTSILHNTSGTGITAGFNSPRSVVADHAGNLYVTDLSEHVISKGVPFALTSFPQNQTALAGAFVSLSVAAAGEGFSYQWLFGDTPILGQTTGNLLLGPLDRTNSGVYSVVVSNSLGNWAAFSATVRVLVPPVIQVPQIADGRPLLLRFQDSDGGVPADLSQLTLQWRTNLPSGDDTNWQSITKGFFLTNGFVAIYDSNAFNLDSRFYRILER